MWIIETLGVWFEVEDTVRKFMKGQVKIWFGLLKILVRYLIN